MFQDYRQRCVFKMKHAVTRACLSRSGIILTVDDSSTLRLHSIHHASQLNINKFLKQNHSLSFTKCTQIAQLSNPKTNHSTSIFTMILDTTLCLIKVSSQHQQQLQQQNKEFIQINEVKLCDLASYYSKNNRVGIKFVNVENGRIVIKVEQYLRSIDLIVIDLSGVDNEQFNISVKTISNLIFGITEANRLTNWKIYSKTNPIISLIHNKYILIHNQSFQTFANCHRLFTYNIDSPQQNSCASIFELPQCETPSRLKHIQFTQTTIKIQESIATLFYQTQKGLTISIVNLKQANIVLSTRIYPLIIFYSFVRNSYCLHQVELRGEDFCFVNNCFLIHCRDRVDGIDKICLLASSSTPQAGIINTIQLDKQFKHVFIDQNYVFAINKKKINELETTPKTRIDSFLLKQLINEHSQNYVTVNRILNDLLY